MPRFIVLPLCWIIFWIAIGSFIHLHPHFPMLMLSPLLAPIAIYEFSTNEAKTIFDDLIIIVPGLFFWAVLAMLFIIPFKDRDR